MKLFLIETIVNTRHIYIVEAPSLDDAQDMVMCGEFEESFSVDPIGESLLSSIEIEEEDVSDVFYENNPELIGHPYFTPENILARIERYVI